MPTVATCTCGGSIQKQGPGDPVCGSCATRYNNGSLPKATCKQCGADSQGEYCSPECSTQAVSYWRRRSFANSGTKNLARGLEAVREAMNEERKWCNEKITDEKYDAVLLEIEWFFDRLEPMIARIVEQIKQIDAGVIMAELHKQIEQLHQEMKKLRDKEEAEYARNKAARKD